MGKIIQRAGVKREGGYLYFLTKEGHIARVQMKRQGEKRSKKWEIVAKVGIKKRKGCLYYVDKNGDIGETTLVIERKHRKPKSKR